MEESDEAAEELYRLYVHDTGYARPRTYADLLLFVRLSGAPVSYHPSAPDGFSGIQVGNWIHVTGREDLTDEDRKRILAHEWCHWLRRSRGYSTTRLYSRSGVARDYEEDVARSFESLFHHASYAPVLPDLFTSEDEDMLDFESNDLMAPRYLTRGTVTTDIWLLMAEAEQRGYPHQPRNRGRRNT